MKEKTKTEPAPQLDHPFRSVLRAGVPLVAFQTPDPTATITACRRAANGKAIPMLEWDCIRGLRAINKEAQAVAAAIGEPMETTNLPQCLSLISDKWVDGGKNSRAVFFIHSANKAIEDWTVVQGIWNLRDSFKTIGCNLVLLGPSVTMPPQLANDVPMFDEPIPTTAEIDELIDRLINDVNEAKKEGDKKDLIPLPEGKGREKIHDTLTGYLSLFGMEQSLALSMTKTGYDVRSLWQLKVAALKSTAGLEISQPTSTFKDLAGCYGIKDFMTKILGGRIGTRGVFFLDEIEKMVAGSSGGDLSGVSQKQIEQFLYWTEEKKVIAVLLVGVPGGGKSWTAACTAGEATVPLLRGSISAAQSSLVGQSTANMRVLLSTVDSVTQGKTLLIATCNSLANLTPEILSRFKEGVFVYDYPTEEERLALWGLYVGKYELEDKTLPDSVNWTGREVESCCRRAWMFRCSLEEAAKSVVPVCRANRDAMETLRRTLSGKFLSAASPGVYEYTDTKAAGVATGRKLSL